MVGDTTRVELFVRSLSPTGARARPLVVIDRLDDLTESGRIDDYAVFVWGKEVGLSTSVAGPERTELVLDRVGQFRAWAADRNAALVGFETREASTLTGETYTALSLPVLALAEYDGEQLVGVAPCRTEHEDRTVERRIEALEATAERTEPATERGLDDREGESPPLLRE
jgi:hypothetical protein